MIFKTDDAATLVVGYHMQALEEAHLQRKTTLKAEVVAPLELGWFTQRRVQEGKLAKLSKRKERRQSCKEKERTGACQETDGPRRLTKGGDKTGNVWFIINSLVLSTVSSVCCQKVEVKIYH